MIDVAKEAGVSRMAVSAVLMGTGRGDIRVSGETAARIRKIAQELDYRPNRAAQHLAGRPSGVIAVVAASWRNFLTQNALAWLNEAAEHHGFRVLAAGAGESLAVLDQQLKDLEARWLDGVVYLAHENDHQWSAVAERVRGIPQVVTAIGDLESREVRSIVSDVTTGAVASVDHLVSRGCQKVVFVTERTDQRAIQSRITAYRQQAESRGLAWTDESVVVATKDWRIDLPTSHPLFEGLLRELMVDRQADGILCDTDFTAVGILRAHRHTPDLATRPLSVVGWGNLQFAPVYDPGITTVAHNLEEILTQVITRLQSGSSNADLLAERVLIPTQLRIRES